MNSAFTTATVILRLFAVVIAAMAAVGIGARPAGAADPAASGGVLTNSAATQAAERQNIIVVFTDDQATWTLGCYGDRDAVTPNLDAFAREAVRFANAFVATPVCSPSRATLLTGRYGTQVGITDWISEQEGNAGLGLAPGTITWPAILQRAGWTTGLFGKWHLGLKNQFYPTKFGFDHFFGFVGNGARTRSPRFDFPDGSRTVEGWTADLITDDALRFIETNRARPFAVCLHYREPHEPYGPMPAVDEAALRDKPLTVPDLPGLDRQQVEQRTRAYRAAVHAIDRNLGRVFGHLKQHGLWERTIVIFTSDHGYSIGQHVVEGKGNAAWIAGGQRGPQRPNLWDLSLRVPLLVRWPGVTTPGAVVPQMVSSIDNFITILSMLGVDPPAEVHHEGLDLSRLLKGQGQPARDIVFAQYDLHNTGFARMRSARTERWKLVRRFDAQLADDLYDLQADPDENDNLVSRTGPRPEVRGVYDELSARLLDWMKSIDDPVLRGEEVPRPR